MKQIFIIVGILVILGVIAFVFGNIGQQQEAQPQSQPVTSPQPAPPAIPENLYNVTGVVLSTGTNSFVLEARIPEINEENRITHRLESRTVFITPGTTITRLVFIQEQGTNRKIPQETEVSFGAIQQGVSVEVVSNKNIIGAQEINATRTRLLPTG